jgi:hypothetical protein
MSEQRLGTFHAEQRSWKNYTQCRNRTPETWQESTYLLSETSET